MLHQSWKNFLVGNGINNLDFKSLAQQPEKLRVLLRHTDSFIDLLKAGLPFDDIIAFKFFEPLLRGGAKVKRLLCQNRVPWAAIKGLQETQPEKLNLLLCKLDSVVELVEVGLPFSDIIEFNFLEELLDHSNAIRFLLTSCKTHTRWGWEDDCVTWAGIKALQKTNPKNRKLELLMCQLDSIIALAEAGVTLAEIIDLTPELYIFKKLFDFIANEVKKDGAPLTWWLDKLKTIVLSPDKICSLQAAGLGSNTIFALSEEQRDLLVTILEKAKKYEPAFQDLSLPDLAHKKAKKYEPAFQDLSVPDLAHILSKKEEVFNQLESGFQLRHIVWLTPASTQYAETKWKQLLYNDWVLPIHQEIVRFIGKTDKKSEKRVRQLHTLLDATVAIVKNNTDVRGEKALQKVVVLKERCEQREHIGGHRNVIGAFLKRIGCALVTFASFGMAWRLSEIRHGVLFHTKTQSILLDAGKKLESNAYDSYSRNDFH